MVVGPFRPAMRTPLSVLAAKAPQASRLIISAADSSREVSFFIMVQIPSSLCCSNQKQSFALRAQVYYNGAKNTVAHATELQKGGEGPGKTSRN